MTARERLGDLNLTLPGVAAPVGSYVPALRSGPLVLTSGQLPFREGTLTCSGKVPADVSVEDAQEAARLSMLNAVAAAAEVAGGLDNIKRVVRVCVYVASSAGFTEQPKVANGSSNLLTDLFGEAGKHARSAVGVAELPLGSPVEVELVVEVT